MNGIVDKKTFLEILISQVIYTVYQLLYVKLYLHICMLLYGLSARNNKWFEQNSVCLRTHCYTSIEVIANNVLPMRR